MFPTCSEQENTPILIMDQHTFIAPELLSLVWFGPVSQSSPVRPNQLGDDSFALIKPFEQRNKCAKTELSG